MLCFGLLPDVEDRMHRPCTATAHDVDRLMYVVVFSYPTKIRGRRRMKVCIFVTPCTHTTDFIKNKGIYASLSLRPTLVQNIQLPMMESQILFKRFTLPLRPVVTEASRSWRIGGSSFSFLIIRPLFSNQPKGFWAGRICCRDNFAIDCIDRSR